MSKRPRPPDDVFFPVVPMLDMSFQLLAFFIMTFQPPSRETRIDLDLPTAPVALPSAGAESPDIIGLETDLVVHASADAKGRLAALRLNESPMVSTDMLADHLRKYSAIVGKRPLRVTLLADDQLDFEEAARVIGACSSAGVQNVRLAPKAGR